MTMNSESANLCKSNSCCFSGTALQDAANRSAVDKFNVLEISGNQNVDNVRNGIHYCFSA